MAKQSSTLLVTCLLAAAGCLDDAVPEDAATTGGKADTITERARLSGEYLSTGASAPTAVERMVLSNMYLTGTYGGSFPWIELERRDGTRDSGMFALEEVTSDAYVIAMAGASRSGGSVAPVVRAYYLRLVDETRAIEIAQIDEAVADPEPEATWLQVVDHDGTLASASTHLQVSTVLWDLTGRRKIRERLVRLAEHVDELVGEAIDTGDVSALAPRASLQNARQD